MRKESFQSFGQITFGPTPIWAGEDKTQEHLHERIDNLSIF